MSKVDFNVLDENVSNGNNSGNNVDFFSLQDGEEAVVRFNISSPEDFELLQVHSLQVNGKYREVNCLRNALEPIENCPFCMNDVPIKRNAYIQMIQYGNTNEGIKPVAKIWTGRSLSMAKKIKSYLDTYGDLKDVLFKVKRTGKGLNTSWEFMPNIKSPVYNDETYYKDFSGLEGYSALGRVVMNKNKEEMEEFIHTGNFPSSTSNNNSYTESDKESYKNNFNDDELPKWSNEPQSRPVNSNFNAFSNNSTNRPVRRY